jgi:alkanesulfonate monooxygenase SsuD/methylene tetrahydromethanopterin reductase-like flavin-dependent oxidoreductase (luciferase family)
MTARMAAAVDDLSGGRLILGVGAGWQEREHKNYGWDLLDVSERFQRFEEGLEIIARLLKSDRPLNYDGKYYQLTEAVLLPRPQRNGGPSLLIGGNGMKRTLSLAAQYADEWNGVFLTPKEYKIRDVLLDDLIIGQGRKPGDVKRSLMTGCVYGKTQNAIAEKVAARTNAQRTSDDLRQRGLVVGTADEIMIQIQQLELAGVERVILQWLDLDDMTGLGELAGTIIS